jgi:hypothetical protein
MPTNAYFRSRMNNWDVGANGLLAKSNMANTALSGANSQ